MNERWLGVRAKALGQNREDQDLQVLWPSLSTALTPFVVVSRTWQTAGLGGPPAHSLLVVYSQSDNLHSRLCELGLQIKLSLG